jgi:hypothetical protein
MDTMKGDTQKANTSCHDLEAAAQQALSMPSSVVLPRCEWS